MFPCFNIYVNNSPFGHGLVSNKQNIIYMKIFYLHYEFISKISLSGMIANILLIIPFVSAVNINDEEEGLEPPTDNHPINGTSLSIFFVFLSLGFGSFLKEINKKFGVIV